MNLNIYIIFLKKTIKIKNIQQLSFISAQNISFYFLCEKDDPVVNYSKNVNDNFVYQSTKSLKTKLIEN